MKDLNEFHFTGQVERFDRITTRTGTPMVAFSVMCWREKIRVVAFKGVAETTDLQRGDHVEVRGHIQSTSWTDKEGQQRSGWQCIAHEITLADDEQQQAEPPASMRADAPEQGNLFPGRREDIGARFQVQPDTPF